jgi:hypothetical protein
MRPGWRYRLLVCCAVMLLVACARPEQGGTPDLVSATPPGKTPGPTQTAVPTRTPEPTSTPTRRPTVTPEPVHLLPGGWQHFGDERFGLQAGAPEHWIDASATFRGADAFRRFAPRLLLLADTEETATSLLSGVPFGSGAFVFGFLAESLAPDSDPVDTVTDQLASVGALDGQSIEVTTITLNDVPAAYTDLAGDPFGVFPAGEQTIQYRLLSLSKPETAANGLFLLATDTSDGESPQELFDMIMNSINLPDSNMNIHNQIISGDVVSSVLQQDTTDIWTFFGEAGRHASITVTPDESDIDLTLALIDPSGEILASIDNGYGGDVETLTDVPLPESGIYIIEAGEFFNAAGSYALNIYLTDFPAFGGGGRIEFGMEVSSELAANAEHEWVFHGVAAQDVTIILSALNEQLDVIVEMRGPYGQELIILDEGFAGDAEIITGFELPLTGEYRIKVRGFAEHGGMYSLTLDEGGESTVNFHDAGDLANGERRREFLQENEAHAWFFYGEAGDMVTITVTPLEPELDLDIWLLDANLSELVMQDDFSSGVSEKIEHELVTAGQYLILVREFFGEIGEYEILLKVERGPVSELTEGSRQ